MLKKKKEEEEEEEERKKYHCKGLGTVENRGVARLEDSNISK